MQARWLLVSSLSLAASCVVEEDKAPGAWEPGRGDGAFELYEAGPVELGMAMDVALEGRVPAFRIESYGGTTLRIALGGRGDGYLVVEGPLADHGDRLAVGAGRVIAEDDDGGPGRDARVDVVLEQPGVYRILAGTYQSLGLGGVANGALRLEVTCSARCERPGIDQKAFVRRMQQVSGGAFVEQAKRRIAAVVPDPALAAQLGARLDAILADPELAGLERFPTISLPQIAAVRPALGGLDAKPPAADQVVRGELAELLGPCTPDRSLPAAVDPRLPDLRSGHFPSTTLAPCQFAHARTLAQILTSLAAGNGSAVTYEGETLTSPAELVGALVETGHTILVRNERMYANFLSMIVGDEDLIWPVWLDTGIALSSGESLVIPVGHSHHAWRITGPLVDTRVMFYLGVSGTAFFGQVDSRPAWSGMITETDVTIARPAGPDFEYLLDTMDTAARYLRRNRIERTTVAAGMPADGYGFVGVCNDSNAVLELATRGTISTFPLLRARQLDGAPDLGDGLDQALRALPKDGDGLADRKDALRRALAMQPFPEGSPVTWDARLGAQLEVARRDAR
jgi:hypothetical protein